MLYYAAGQISLATANRGSMQDYSQSKHARCRCHTVQKCLPKLGSQKSSRKMLHGAGLEPTSLGWRSVAKGIIPRWVIAFPILSTDNSENVREQTDVIQHTRRHVIDCHLLRRSQLFGTPVRVLNFVLIENSSTSGRARDDAFMLAKRSNQAFSRKADRC